LAQPVPFGRVRAEIRLGGRRAGRPHRRQPLAVAHDRRVGRIEPGKEPPRHLRRDRAVGEAKKRPASLAEAFHQAGVGEQLQVARDARLRLPQNLGQVGDRQLGFGEERQHAQPRRFTGCLEHGMELREADREWRR
jgi:hypothetical protein